jgi:hypothetical protein
MIGGKPKISDLVIGARNMIEAADIRRGDSVLLLADRSSDGDSIDALASAIRLHGATPMEMIVEPILRYGDVPEAALRAMEAVDVAVWIWPVFLNGSTNYRERLRTPKEGDEGAPTDRVKPYKIYFEGWPGLLATDYARFPNDLLWTIARKVKAIVAAGSKVTISGPNGTKLVAEYDNKRIYAMQTKAGEPAGRCHFPWGRCGVYNGSGTANGTVQLDLVQGVPGMLREPMLWTIKDGKVIGIEGGGDIGAETKRLFKAFPESNFFTEVMFGYHPKASTERGIQDPMHWEILSRYPWVGLGTQRKHMVYRHVDGGCMESNLAIDGFVLVDFGGKLTILDDPEIRAAARRYGDADFLLSTLSHEGTALGGLW